MNILKRLCSISLMIGGMTLTACDHPETAAIDATEKAKVLPYLNAQNAQADYQLAHCKKHQCVDIDIQTIKTQDSWLNHWIAKLQANVIQQQIQQQQDLSLQQAIDVYVQQSNEWQAQYSKNQAYTLHMQTQIATQRNQYVLLQLQVDAIQEDRVIKDRLYFYVADRQQQKILSILDIIQPQQQSAMNDWLQQYYQTWKAKQSQEVKRQLPQNLAWQQTDWFFDREGIGLHYRSHEISKDAPQLDIYLSAKQTQQWVQPEIYQHMF